MKHLNFTDKEKKIILILMLINCFALFVNYFGLSPKIKNTDNDYYVCLFTNSVKTEGYYGTAYGTNLVQYSPYKSESSFYPFVDFYKSWYDGFYFNGLFPSYDSTEFFIYTLLIFGFFIVKKIISNKNEEEIIPIETGTLIVKKQVKFNKSKEYKQLKNLYDLEIINDEEFKNKAKLLKKKMKNDLE
jgi:hypothetical protein